MTLAGCSKNSRDFPEIKVQIEPQKTTHPPTPSPLKLEQPKWQACGDKVCMTVDEAKKVNRNSVAVGRWMGQAKAALTYYRGSDNQAPPAE